MTGLSINGPINKYDLYSRAYDRLLNDYKDNSKQDLKPILKKLAVLGVKIIITSIEAKILTCEEIKYNFQYSELIKGVMSTLTPREFMNLFPISKEYYGYKRGTKDYFYTMDVIKKLPQDKPIGKEIDNLLWDYTNTEIIEFMVHSMKYLDDYRQLEGFPSLAEEWAEAIGVCTYRMYSDQKGREFLLDRKTGKTIKAKKARPRYLKLLKM